MHGVIADTDITRWAGELLAAAGRSPSRRYVLGIAGVPGSGKSTLAQLLCDEANARQPGTTRVVPMDGFHLSNDLLTRRGLVERKGAPETFDAKGYLGLLRRCRDASFTGAIPTYDRRLHEPVISDKPEHRVDVRTRLIIAEGNYLLLDVEPWRELRGLLDEVWFLRIGRETAKRRLLQRHLRGGKTPAEAEQRCINDRVNSELILNRCSRADRVLDA